MESGSIPQRNVVGVITGLMGSGKTTLLHHLFGMAPPDLYTSTGVAKQSYRGFLHHIVLKSGDSWKRLSYENIRERLAPLIRAGMKEADVHSLAVNLMSDMDPLPLPASSSTVEHTSSDNDAAEVTSRAHTPPPLEKESPSCQKMVEKVVKSETNPTQESEANPTNDLLLEFVHMIDTGGQPELMEVMPSLIHNANLALVLGNLQHGLSKYPPINYHEEGVGFKRQLSSHYNSRNIILKLVSTLHAKKSLDQAFRLLIVATHRDCVETNVETEVEALNTELNSLLLPAFKDELILFKPPNQIPFVLNLKNPEDRDKHAIEVIRREVGAPGLGSTFKTPASFFVFEQDLLQFAENVAKRNILSLDECRQVGARLKMNDEMVEAALVLFHHQNTFLYFRHVLPNHVFISPQVALEIVDSIVSFRYKVNDGKFKGFPAKFVTQLNEGIISEELLSYDKVSPHFQKDIYEIQDAIKLFRHTFTLAPLHSDRTGGKSASVKVEKKEYLMMCLMPAIPDQKLNDYTPESSDTVPLVINFSSGCVPLGCFGSTIACLISKYGWEVHREKEYGPPKCLAHNIASLYIPDLLVYITLVDHTQFIKIHVSSDLSFNDLPPNSCYLIYTTVFGAIEKVYDIMHLDPDLIKISPAVVCSCQPNSHFANFKKIQGKYYLKCSKKVALADGKQLLWMSNDGANSSTPTLPQMMRLKIPEKVGTEYEKFGTLLLKDDTGSRVASTKETCHHEPERIVTSILRIWLQEEPTPVTWENLIKVLKDADLNRLAGFVQKTHREQLF